jgi:hypothetical protein
MNREKDRGKYVLSTGFVGLSYLAAYKLVFLPGYLALSPDDVNDFH